MTVVVMEPLVGGSTGRAGGVGVSKSPVAEVIVVVVVLLPSPRKLASPLPLKRGTGRVFVSLPRHEALTMERLEAGLAPSKTPPKRGLPMP